MFMPADTATYELPPAGTDVAVCYRVVDLGTQKTNYNGEEDFKRQLAIGWELPNQLMKDGKPFTQTSFFTFSSNEKAKLRLTLESWRGKAFTKEELPKFNIKNLIGVPCLLTIIHKPKQDGSMKAAISGIVPLMRGMEKPQQINLTSYLSLESDAFDQTAYNDLPKGLREIIAKSAEYQQIVHPAAFHGANAPEPNTPMDNEGHEFDRGIPF